MSTHNPNPHENATTVQPEHCDNEYVVLPKGVTNDDVQYGVRYRATVQHVSDGGLQVTLRGGEHFDSPAGNRGGGRAKRAFFNADETRDQRVVNGFAHKFGLPPGYNPYSFKEGDHIGVMLYERRDDGQLNFETVAALDTLRGVTFETDPRNAPTPELAPAFNRPADADVETETATDETPKRTIAALTAGASGSESEAAEAEGDTSDDEPEAPSEDEDAAEADDEAPAESSGPDPSPEAAEADEADETDDEADETDETVCEVCGETFRGERGKNIHKAKTHDQTPVYEQAADAVAEGAVDSGEVGEAMGKSRQSAMSALKRAVEKGLLTRERTPEPGTQARNRWVYSLPDDESEAEQESEVVIGPDDEAEVELSAETEADIEEASEQAERGETKSLSEVEMEITLDADEAHEKIDALRDSIEAMTDDVDTLVARLGEAADAADAAEAVAAATGESGDGYPGDEQVTREQAIETLTDGLSPRWALFIRSTLDVAAKGHAVTSTTIELGDDGARLAIETTTDRQPETDD